MTDLEKLLRSSKEEDFQRALQQLQRLPVGEAIRMLEELAEENNVDYRCGALIGIVSISQERAEGLAIKSLRDPHPAVREYACDTLGQSQSAKAIANLAERLANDPDDWVRGWAAFWLGEIGDESVLPALMTAAEHDNGTDHEGTPIREHSIKAIQKIRSRVAGSR